MKQIALFVLVFLFASVALVLAQNDAKCGIKGPPPPGNLGIRNGTDAEPNEFPWMIFLQAKITDDIALSCGASILNNQWVLTAAHCVWNYSANKPYPKENFYIMAGQHSSNKLDNTTITLSAIKVIAHEHFNTVSTDSDFALLKLNETLDLGLKQVGSICLPAKQKIDQIAGHSCVATGWGSLDDYVNVTLPAVLQKLTSHVWKQDRCKTIRPDVNDHNLCWGEADEGVCKGDSGGPLICHVDGKWYQYGVASWVKGDSHSGCESSVFARTSEFSKWIWEKIRAN